MYFYDMYFYDKDSEVKFYDLISKIETASSSDLSDEEWETLIDKIKFFNFYSGYGIGYRIFREFRSLLKNGRFTKKEHKINFFMASASICQGKECSADIINTYEEFLKEEKDLVLSNIKKVNNNVFCGHLLSLPLPEDAEVEIAKKISGKVYLNDSIFKNKYVLKKEVLDKLAPITRLKYMNSLIEISKKRNYNIFGDLSRTDLDKFLFPCLTRKAYAGVVSNISEYFNLITAIKNKKYKGVIAFSCPKGCGNFTIDINCDPPILYLSEVKQNIRHLVTYCPVCRAWLGNNKRQTFELVEIK